jgi:hypothetical protein
LAKYPTTKTLKKVYPTINTTTNIVKKVEIEVVYSHTSNTGTTWARTYSHTEDVEYLNKEITDFTKAELIALMPSTMEVVFDAHYDAHNTPPTEERISNFNINELN